jgi:hypothetical protein
MTKLIGGTPPVKRPRSLRNDLGDGQKDRAVQSNGELGLDLYISNIKRVDPDGKIDFCTTPVSRSTSSNSVPSHFCYLWISRSITSTPFCFFFFFSVIRAHAFFFL